MKITRQIEKTQNSTVIGMAGICTQFLAVFGKVEISNLSEQIIGMNCQDAFTAFAPFVLFGWSIWFNEEGKNSDEKIKYL